MKPETQKQYAATLKAFKAADTYLAQHRKLEEAFAALEAEREKVEKGHKAFLVTAGNLEANRLLGEMAEGDTKNLDAGLMQMRDQQDRLIAAKEALQERKKALFAQLEEQTHAAGRALTDIANALREELNDELKDVAEKLSSIAARYYAVYSGTRFESWHNRDLFGLRVYSLSNNENLFHDPGRPYPRENGEVVHRWEHDTTAVKMFEQLRGLGQTNRTLQRMEKEYLDANVGT